MAVFSPAANRPLQGGSKGSSAGFRFIIYALISAVLMFFDHSQHYLEEGRYVLQAVAYWVQLAVSSPTKGVSWMQDNMRSRDGLAKQNQQLKADQRKLELEVERYEALETENSQLRGLKDKLPPVVHKWLVGEVMQVQLDSLRSRIVVNVGRRNGVFKGQTVIDDAGVIGQTTHVGPWSTEVILITDPEHAIPVVVEHVLKGPDPANPKNKVPLTDEHGNVRTISTLHTIAVGAGDQASLALPYLPANAEIDVGDRLLTSGLGGVFPAGYPVAKVTEVHKDGVQPLAQIRAVPFARCCAALAQGSFTSDREVVMVWFRESHPAAPMDTVDDSDLKARKECLQGALDSTQAVLKKIQPEQGAAAARDLKTTAADSLMKGFECLDPPFRTQPQDGPAAGTDAGEKGQETAHAAAAAEGVADGAAETAGAVEPPAGATASSTAAAPAGRPAAAAARSAGKPGASASASRSAKSSSGKPRP
jgi:rod shape-determining protein MreC